MFRTVVAIVCCCFCCIPWVHGMCQSVSLKAEVTRCMADATGPFLRPLPASCVDVADDVTFSCDDLIAVSGRTSYDAMAQQFPSLVLPELAESTFGVTQVTTVQPNVVSATWNVTFTSDALTTLVWWCRALGVKVEFFNLLDKERMRSMFSWQAFRTFLERILYTGVARLPHAVIVGKTDFVFDEIDDTVTASPATDGATRKRYRLRSSTERLNLIRCVDQEVLKNRKLATDLLEFLDARRPPAIGLNDWNDLLTRRVNTRSVGGMGQFDIDGLEGEQQAELLGVANRVLGWSTALVLALGLAFSTSAMNKVFFYQRQGREREISTSVQDSDDYF